MPKVVLVTGSSRGIGRSSIIEFAKHGYDVIINYVNSKDKAYDLANYVAEKYNVKALVIKADISNEDEIKNMIRKIKNDFKKIDVLVNNAAVACDNYFNDKTKEEFMKVLEVNLVGTFLVSKYASKIMDNGMIINVSSRDAIDTYNDISIDYCASKSGVNSLTKTLSMALPNIRVLAVCPPWVRTDGVEEMSLIYLKEELKRTNQKELMEKETVAKFIYNLVQRDVKSGSILLIEEGE